MVTRIDGHGCGGCYNCRKYEKYHYCKSMNIGGDIKYVNDMLCIPLIYRIIECKLDERPNWCPYN